MTLNLRTTFSPPWPVCEANTMFCPQQWVMRLYIIVTVPLRPTIICCVEPMLVISQFLIRALVALLLTAAVVLLLLPTLKLQFEMVQFAPSIDAIHPPSSEKSNPSTTAPLPLSENV